MSKVSIIGLGRDAVLAALYNASRPQGLGFLSYDKAPMTVEEAGALLSPNSYFDYLKGRVMKLSIPDNVDEIDTTLYDRDNGEGKAADVISALRSTGLVNPPDIAEIHASGVVSAATTAKALIDTPNVESQAVGGVAVVTLGLSDAKDKLLPAINEAVDAIAQEKSPE